MEQLHITLFCIGLLIVVFSLINRYIKKAPLSEPLLAMIFGILCGPAAFNFIHLQSWGNQHNIMHTASMLTMAMALMATALRLPEKYVNEARKPLGVILTAGMVLMCLFSTLVVYLLLDISFLLALLIGAIITPTDPVIATSIVSGKIAEKYLPSRIRHFISAESGANDGLAYVLVFLPYLLISHPQKAWSEWFFKVLLWENLAAILIAFFLGYGAGKLLRFSLQRDVINRKAFLAFFIAISFAVLGGMELIHTNGIIAVFTAGIGIVFLITKEEDIQAERVQEMMERLFTIPIFILFGSILPWESWINMGWTATVCLLLVLVFRRIPVVFLLKPFLGNLPFRRDQWFIGWFGPIGVAALFYASMMTEKLHQDILWTVPSLIIFGSTVAHGITAYPFIKKYAVSNKKEEMHM